MRSRWWGNAPALVGLVVALAGSACIESKNYAPAPPAALIPTLPQPRLPQNGAYEGSTVLGRLRPRFAWEPSTVEGEGTLRYELQYSADAMFLADVTTVETEQPSHQPASALGVSTTPPVGRRYYWRVRACVGESCSEYSKSWMVNLGRSIKDFNGDGYDDTLVGSHTSLDETDSPGRVYVYLGGTGTAFNTAVRATLRDFAMGSWFGVSVDTAGDFNGDGFADVLIGAPQSNNTASYAGRAYLYFGGAGNSIDETPDVVFEGTAENAALGTSVSSAGDVNADGFSDVIVGAPAFASVGRAYLYFGAKQPLSVATIDGTLAPASAVSLYGTAVSGVGDVDGDGFSDVAISSAGYQTADASQPCIADLYRGGEGSSFDATRDGQITGGVGERCYLKAIAAGDVNSDGFSDVIARISQRAEGARLFLGSAQLTTMSDAVFSLSTGHKCLEAASVGDVNGDGAADIAVSDAASRSSVDISIYLGKVGAERDAVAKSAAATFTKNIDPTFFGWVIRGAGDINGDGFGDIILGDQAGPNSEGSFYVYFGNGGATIDGNPDGIVVGGTPRRFLGFSVR